MTAISGTLRSVLGYAAPAGGAVPTVTFDPAAFPAAQSAQTIVLLGGEIDVRHSVTVAGPPTGVIVSGNGQSRVFGIRGGTAAFSGLTIEGGQAPMDGSPFFGGGGGLAVGGGAAAALTDCTIQNDVAPDGGGILNFGTVALTACDVFTNGSGDAGGGVYNLGSLTATLSRFQGNGAGAGGGVYNAGGAVLLADDVLDSETAGGDGGDADNESGMMALTGCAVTNGSAADAVFNGGDLTMTSCTLTGGQGGGLVSAGGAATLIDDVLYGDGGSEIAGSVQATRCDLQGNPGTPAAPDAGGNFSADPQFDGSLRPSATSPVLGRGTTVASDFRAADLFGQPFFDPPALGAVEGPEDAHVLWTNPDGRTIFWDVSPLGSALVAGNYGPLAGPGGATGYAARALSTGPDGVSHILWSTPAGRVALSSVTTTGARADVFYGPFSDDGTAATTWQPVAVSTGGDGLTHLLWDNPNGRTILWDVNPDGTFAVAADYGGFSDDGTAGTTWKAVALASDASGLNSVLWNNPDGRTLLWGLDGADDQPAGSGSPATAVPGSASTAYSYGVFSDDGTANTLWHARAVSVGQDDLPRLLWTNPDGRTILWSVNADGTFVITGNYAPLLDPAGRGGFTAVALATGADDRSHLAFGNPNGETFLWSLLNDGGSGTNDTVTPSYFGVFSDDGTANTFWKAVAVSAAQAVNQNFAPDLPGPHAGTSRNGRGNLPRPFFRARFSFLTPPPLRDRMT